MSPVPRSGWRGYDCPFQNECHPPRSTGHDECRGHDSKTILGHQKSRNRKGIGGRVTNMAAGDHVVVSSSIASERQCGCQVSAVDHGFLEDSRHEGTVRWIAAEFARASVSTQQISSSNKSALQKGLSTYRRESGNWILRRLVQHPKSRHHFPANHECDYRPCLENRYTQIRNAVEPYSF